MYLDEDLQKSDIGIKKITGGSVTDSFMVRGVCFKKTFSYAGFEQQPKSFQNPKIICMNLELELKAEKDSAEIRLSNPDDFQLEMCDAYHGHHGHAAAPLNTAGAGSAASSGLLAKACRRWTSSSARPRVWSACMCVMKMQRSRRSSAAVPPTPYRRTSWA